MQQTHVVALTQTRATAGDTCDATAETCRNQCATVDTTRYVHNRAVTTDATRLVAVIQLSLLDLAYKLAVLKVWGCPIIIALRQTADAANGNRAANYGDDHVAATTCNQTTIVLAHNAAIAASNRGRA